VVRYITDLLIKAVEHCCVL